MKTNRAANHISRATGRRHRVGKMPLNRARNQPCDLISRNVCAEAAARRWTERIPPQLSNCRACPHNCGKDTPSRPSSRRPSPRLPDRSNLIPAPHVCCISIIMYTLHHKHMPTFHPIPMVTPRDASCGITTESGNELTSINASGGNSTAAIEATWPPCDSPTKIT